MSRLDGLEANFAVFTALDQSARTEMAKTLEKIGQTVLAAQRAAAPVRTGRLRDALTVAEAVGVLRVRIGYPNMKSGRDPLFYAIFQEFGVKAGQRVVTRLNKRQGRTVEVGKYKRYPRLTYPLSWHARAPRPFVLIEDRLDGLINAAISGFWEGVLSRAGAE